MSKTLSGEKVSPHSRVLFTESPWTMVQPPQILKESLEIYSVMKSFMFVLTQAIINSLCRDFYTGGMIKSIYIWLLGRLLVERKKIVVFILDVVNLRIQLELVSTFEVCLLM